MTDKVRWLLHIYFVRLELCKVSAVKLVISEGHHVFVIVGQLYFGDSFSVFQAVELLPFILVETKTEQLVISSSCEN